MKLLLLLISLTKCLWLFFFFSKDSTWLSNPNVWYSCVLVHWLQTWQKAEFWLAFYSVSVAWWSVSSYQWIFEHWVGKGYREPCPAVNTTAFISHFIHACSWCSYLWCTIIIAAISIKYICIFNLTHLRLCHPFYSHQSYLYNALPFFINWHW